MLLAVDVRTTEGPAARGHQCQLSALDLTHTSRVAQLQRCLVVVVEAVNIALGQQPPCGLTTTSPP